MNMRNMSFGFRVSVALHVVLFIIAVFGIPSLFKPEPLEEMSVITVEVLPISQATNVKPKKPMPKPQEKKEIITKEIPKISLPEPKSQPEMSKPEPVKKPEVVKPEVKKPEPAPVPKKPEPKKEEKPKEEEKKKPEIQEDAFASVLKSVEEFREKPQEKTEKKEEETDFSEVEDFLADAKTEQPYKPGLPLSISEKDAIRQQIMKNWTVLGGAKDAKSMIVTLRIELAQDGAVKDVTIVDKLRYSSDSFFRAMADSAVRAVHKSSPLKNLPPEKYEVKDGWRDLELRFDPSEMLY